MKFPANTTKWAGSLIRYAPGRRRDNSTRSSGARTFGVILPLVLLSVSAASSAVQPLFDSTYLAYDLGASGYSMAVEDFNEDGILDVASTSFPAGWLTCILGNADGTFEAPTILTLPDWTLGLATADFNGDGLLDAAVTIPESSLVVVCLGNGDGTFRTGPPPAHTEGWPSGIVAGNLDNDDIPDVALGTGRSTSFTVMSGLGDGTFAPPVTYPCLYKTGWVALGDLNRDGWPDIAVSNLNYVSTFFNIGGTGFGQRHDYGVGSASRPVLADMNADSWPDLLVGSTLHGPAAAVFRNDGTGILGSRMDYGCPGFTSPDVAVGDPNRDGRPDILMVNTFADMTLWFGAGNGSFSGRTDYVTGYSGNVIACHDVDGDAWPDILVNADGILAVSYNRGDGTYRSGRYSPTPDQPLKVLTGDVNGDSRVDCVVLAYSNVIAVLPGNGDGTFEPYSSFTISIAPASMILEEINGDGKPDLVGVSTAGTVLVLLGNGDGTFSPGPSHPVGAGSFVVAAGRFNDDEMTDLVTLNGTSDSFSVLLGHGDGTFSAQTSYPISNPEKLAVGDLNHDGFTDLAVIARHFPVGFETHLSNGDGQFPDGYTFNIPPGNCIALGDVNNNGNIDAVIPEYILSGTGTGSFYYPPSLFDFGDGLAREMSLSDLDSDGNLDLILPWWNSDVIAVLRGNGDGSFTPQVNYGISKGPEGFAVADFNDDGNPDIVLPCRSKDYVSVLLNTRAPVSGVAGPNPTSLPHLSVHPNPFRTATRLDLTLTAPGWTTIDAFDALGRHVRSLLDADLEPGTHGFTWDGRNDQGLQITSGVYWIRARGENGIVTRRILAVR